MRDDFAVFILSHGRPEEAEARTLRTLRMSRYTGAWYIILDTEDTTAPAYVEKFGADRIITFDKATVPGVDLADNFTGPRGVVVYARNAVDRIAADLGLSYVMVLDDDYNYFAHRVDRENALSYAYCYHLDALLEAMIDFLDDSGALTVAFAQGGDFIGGHRNADHHDGGPGSEFVHRVKRKAMNTFVCRVGRPVTWPGRINEDVTAYVLGGTRGHLFYTITAVSIDQANTQEQQGGLTAAYLDLGTYVKSFYTVMHAPSCVKISTLGDLAHRIHHHVSWNNAVPKVLSDTHRKAPA